MSSSPKLDIASSPRLAPPSAGRLGVSPVKKGSPLCGAGVGDVSISARVRVALTSAPERQNLAREEQDVPAAPLGEMHAGLEEDGLAGNQAIVDDAFGGDDLIGKL